MQLLQSKKYTIEDIYQLPEGTRAELLNGQLYFMAPPTVMHQRILNYLCTEITLYIRKNKGNCEVFPAPFAVFLENNKDKYVEPDISVICDKNQLDEHGCHGAPDWVIEIVSPSSKSMDYYTKLSEYKNAGVREYWIVDPMKKIVLVYDMEENAAPVLYPFDACVKANIYQHLEIDFSHLLH